MTQQRHELVQVNVPTKDLDALRMSAGTLGVSVSEIVRTAVHKEVESYKTDPEKRATVAGYIGRLQDMIGEAPTPSNTGHLPVPDERLSR